VAANSDISDIAKRYATAFIDLAEESKKLDKVAKDLSSLAELLNGSDDLQQMIVGQNVSREDQRAAIVAVGKKAKFEKLTLNFLGTLAENRRLSILSLIISKVQAVIAEKSGELTADVISAKALTKTQVKNLGESLKKALGSTVVMNLKEDPELLGGLVIKVGSIMVDNSVKTKLERLHRAMKKQSAPSEEAQMKEVA